MGELDIDGGCVLKIDYFESIHLRLDLNNESLYSFLLMVLLVLVNDYDRCC